MSVAEQAQSTQVQIPALSLVAADEVVTCTWAGGFVSLGAELRRVGAALPSLTVALTLPALDLAAICVAAGWRLTDPPPEPIDLDVLSEGQSVHLLAGRNVVSDRFYGFAANRTQIHVGKSRWKLDRGSQVFPASNLSPDRFNRFSVPDAGPLARQFLTDESWLRFHATSQLDVGLIGTKNRLHDECELLIGVPGEAGADRIEDLLRPDHGTSPGWSSVILPGTIDRIDQCFEASLLILEGPGGIRWLNSTKDSVTVCLIDRSAADESALDMVIQARATSRPLSPSDFAWTPPAGVEMLAFERGT